MIDYYPIYSPCKLMTMKRERNVFYYLAKDTVPDRAYVRRKHAETLTLRLRPLMAPSSYRHARARCKLQQFLGFWPSRCIQATTE